MNSKSSNCCRVTGASPFAIRRRPSHQPAAKPTRYMRPYQRTASGPMEIATGSILGWISMGAALAREASRLRRKFASCGAERAAAPGKPQVEPRMRLGDLAVDDPAPAEIGERARHDRYTQPARHQAYYGLHLNCLLGYVERKARARRKTGHDIVQAGRDLARHHDEGFAGKCAYRKPTAPAGETVARRKRGHETLALHDEVLQPGGAGNGRQEQAEIQVAGCQRSRLLGRKHLAQRERNAWPRCLVGLQQAGQHAVVGKRDEADPQPPALAGSHAVELRYRGLELCR